MWCALWAWTLGFAGTAEAARPTLLVLSDARVPLDGALIDAARQEASVKYDVVDRAQTDAHTKAAAGLGLLCTLDQTDCLVKSGTLAGVDRVLVIAIRADAFALRLVDTKTGAELRALGAPIEKDASASIRRATRRLWAEQGGLVVKAEPDGARIFVDDRLVGQSPLSAPITGLSAGMHRLRIEHPGHVPLKSGIEIKAGERVVVSFILTPTPSAAPPALSQTAPPGASSKTPGGAADAAATGSDAGAGRVEKPTKEGRVKAPPGPDDAVPAGPSPWFYASAGIATLGGVAVASALVVALLAEGVFFLGQSFDMNASARKSARSVAQFGWIGLAGASIVVVLGGVIAGTALWVE